MSEFVGGAAFTFGATSPSRAGERAEKLSRGTRQLLKAYSAEEREQIAELLDTLRAKPEGTGAVR